MRGIDHQHDLLRNQIPKPLLPARHRRDANHLLQPLKPRGIGAACLIESSAEISTLSRNIHHLTSLLREGAFRSAQEYRPMLDTLGAAVRAHLTLAARVLAELQPRRFNRNEPLHPTA